MCSRVRRFPPIIDKHFNNIQYPYKQPQRFYVQHLSPSSQNSRRYSQLNYTTKPSLDLSQHSQQSMISNSFLLSEKVSKYLNGVNKNSKSFERLLSHFRSNVHDDACFNETLKLFEETKDNKQSNGLTLSDNSIIISLDTGGENVASDFGLCIYDVLTKSVFKIHVGIIGMRQSKRSKDMSKLMTSPLKLEVHESKKLLRFIANYYFKSKMQDEEREILIVGHNLEKDLKSMSLLGFEVPWDVFKIDTEHLARHMITSSSGSKLRKVAMGLGINETKPFHPSVNDAYYTLLVLLRLLGSQCFDELEFLNLRKEYKIYENKLRRNLIKFWIKTKLLEDKLSLSKNKLKLKDGTIIERKEIDRLIKKLLQEQKRTVRNDDLNNEASKINTVLTTG